MKIMLDFYELTRTEELMCNHRIPIKRNLEAKFWLTCWLLGQFLRPLRLVINH